MHHASLNILPVADAGRLHCEARALVQTESAGGVLGVNSELGHRSSILFEASQPGQQHCAPQADTAVTAPGAQHATPPLGGVPEGAEAKGGERAVGCYRHQVLLGTVFRLLHTVPALLYRGWVVAPV